MKQYICIDIGGTSIKYGMIQEDGGLLVTGEMPTEAMEKGGSRNYGENTEYSGKVHRRV